MLFGLITPFWNALLLSFLFYVRETVFTCVIIATFAIIHNLKYFATLKNACLKVLEKMNNESLLPNLKG